MYLRHVIIRHTVCHFGVHFVYVHGQEDLVNYFVVVFLFHFKVFEIKSFVKTLLTKMEISQLDCLVNFALI